MLCACWESMESDDRLIESPIHTVFRIRKLPYKHHIIANEGMNKEMEVVTH